MTSAAPEKGTTPQAAPVVLGDDLGIAPEVRRAAWGGLDPATAAALLALCGDGTAEDDAGPSGEAGEADDADTAAGTQHVWIPDETGPVAYVRVRPVTGPDGAEEVVVERLRVRADVRQLGLAGALLADVVARAGGAALVAVVPPAAVPLFARFGFGPAASGPAGGPDDARRMRRAPDTPWRE